MVPGVGGDTAQGGNDHQPNDRVYQFADGEGVYASGPDKVRNLLRDDPVGHKHDSHTELSTGYGARKPPSRPSLKVVKDT